MSDTVDLKRATLLNDQESVAMMANMFGAFLGMAIVECSRGFPSRWIRTNEEIGVEVTYGDRTARFFPTSRVYRQIEFGGSQSIWSMFQTMLTLLQDVPKDDTVPNAAIRPNAKTAAQAAFPSGWRLADSEEERVEVSSKAAKVQTVSPQDLAQLELLVDRTIQFYRKHVPDFGYDARSVKIMSDHLDKQPAKLLADPAKLRTVANTYGAFLRKTIIACNPQFLGRWIRSGEEIGVEIVCGSQTFHAFTVSRIAKQIESAGQTAHEIFQSILKPQSDGDRESSADSVSAGSL